jgi:hypothetical protein
LSLKIGDIVEQDGQQLRIINIKEQNYEDGTKVTVTTYEPIS